MATDRRLVAIRDVLTRRLRDLALELSQLDMSIPDPPAPIALDQAQQYVHNLVHAVNKATVDGARVNGPIYCERAMVEAIQDGARGILRVATSAGELTLCAPPEGYTLGSIEDEVYRATRQPELSDEPLTREKLLEYQNANGVNLR